LLELPQEILGCHRQRHEVPARVQANPLEALVAGERAGNLRDTALVAEDILHRSILIPQLEVPPDIDRRRDARSVRGRTRDGRADGEREAPQHP
jgi:hypothetical protein